MNYNIFGDNMNEIEKLQSFIDESNNIVFFGGAGVSTLEERMDYIEIIH